MYGEISEEQRVIARQMVQCVLGREKGEISSMRNLQVLGSRKKISEILQTLQNVLSGICLISFNPWLAVVKKVIMLFLIYFLEVICLSSSKIKRPKSIYSYPLDNVSLNCMGLLMRGFFFQ